MSSVSPKWEIPPPLRSRKVYGQNCHYPLRPQVPHINPSLSKVPLMLTVQCVLICSSAGARRITSIHLYFNFLPLTLLPIQPKQGSYVLKQLHQLKAKALRGSNSPRTRRGLMILKIFLGMEWVSILGGDVGLYIYLFFLVWFGPKNYKVNGYYAFLHFLSSALPRSARLVSFR